MIPTRLALLGAALPLLLSPTLSLAQSAGEAAMAPKPGDMLVLAEKLAPSLVRVEYVLQYDKGEAPPTAYNPMRAADPSRDQDAGNWEQLIKDERPATFAGYAISPTRVIASDPLLHPRFIKSISIRVGDRAIPARIVAHPTHQSALIIEAAEPMTGVTPLNFDASKEPAYHATYNRVQGEWRVYIAGASFSASVGPEGREFYADEGLYLAKDGTPVGYLSLSRVPVDDSWKGSPEKWALVSETDFGAGLARAEQVAAGAVLRVDLGFRSPPANAQAAYDRYSGGAEEAVTDWHGVGLLLDSTTLLVLNELKPKSTARLESITVHPTSGEPVTAKFSGTLLDYGAFIATLDSPLQGAAAATKRPLAALRDELLYKAEVRVLGETRTAYMWHDRINHIITGWRDQLFPVAEGASYSYSYSDYYSGGGAGSKNETFLFDSSGELAAFSLARREKVVVQDRWGGSSWGGSLVPASTIATIVKEKGKNLDPENCPRSEEDENRLAWLGVELQQLDEDLARVNNVVDQTFGGRSGGIVTYVYPGSPAEKAGIVAGDILLRLHVEGQPKPLEITATPNYAGMFDQMWAQMDEIPEEYFDRMPQPWGSAETPLTRALTDIGFGTAFVAELFREGKVSNLNFKVEQAPAHYDAAKRHKSEAAGLTVRDLTYEVRRYFQLADDAPGVIISKIERGEKSSVAGLKPYEIITAINDQPIKTVADLEAAVAKGGELRINVKRMTEGRIVKIQLDAGESKVPEAAPAEPKTP